MIHYHGTPITPNKTALELLKGRHGFVSFEPLSRRQVELVAEQCQSFALDNGAFTIWKQGGTLDVAGYAAWVNKWRRHPGFDFALIPDVIEGSEAENDRMLAVYRQAGGDVLHDVPVWHLHESIERLQRLCRGWQRVALGSSGVYQDPGSDAWWGRMSEALDAIVDEHGSPPCKLHGLRMLDPSIFSHLPLASADSTNVARNIGIDQKWDRARFAPKCKSVRAHVIASNVEHHASAATWQRTRGRYPNGELFG